MPAWSTYAVFSRCFWASSPLPPLPALPGAESFIPRRSLIDLGGVVDAAASNVSGLILELEIPVEVLTRALGHHLIQAAVRMTPAQGIETTIEARVERTRKRLAARNEGPPSSPSVAIVFFVIQLGLILDKRLDDLLDVTNLNQNIFRLEIRVDYTALSM